MSLHFEFSLMLPPAKAYQLSFFILNVDSRAYVMLDGALAFIQCARSEEFDLNGAQHWVKSCIGVEHTNVEGFWLLFFFFFGKSQDG